MRKHQLFINEQHRPQFHFSPKSSWMNDPNGMFYYNGKYHLFYQYCPDDIVFGATHWGHAISKDLVFWLHLPIALYPDSMGYIFSGGAVVDVNNTSNFGTREHPPIVATFTHHNIEQEKAGKTNFQCQSIAFSVDEGNKWQKYIGNPIIPNKEQIKDFRDPKVVWHEDSKQWILVLAAYDRVKFYASTDFKHWRHLSDFGIEGDHRLWECPDLFPMKVHGSNERKWVLIVSIQKKAPNGGTATSYFVGEFDGEEFISDIKNQKWLDWGADNYAFVTWNNIPKKNNEDRKIGIGWMSNWQYAEMVPTKSWRSALTLPRELKLVKFHTDYILYNQPIHELQKLRKEYTFFDELTVSKEYILKGQFKPSQSELLLNVNLKKNTANIFGVKLYNEVKEYISITFNRNESKVYVDRTNSRKDKFSKDFFYKIHHVPVNFDQDIMHIHIYFDVASLEMFINHGQLSFTDIFFPSKPFNMMSLFAENGNWHISNMKVYALKSIW